jgi:glycosyltransferase involved in cell wall biosynthesis
MTDNRSTRETVVGTTDSQLRVAVDARVVQDAYHGIGRQTFELLRALEGRDDVSVEIIHGTETEGRLAIRELIADGGEAHELDAPIASTTEQFRWPRVLRHIRADFVLVPYHLSVPLYSPIPVACFVHDCIFEESAAYSPGARVRALYRLATRIALARSACVLTVSEATRIALGRYYGLELPEAHVIKNGVDGSFRRRVDDSDLERARAALRLPERYILHVGVGRPHKNRVVLVRALAHLADLEPPVHLVLVGSRDARFADDVAQAINELSLRDRVHRIDTVPEEHLAAVYQAAACFAFPSRVEGFGLPVLEAMASRVPVVASDVPVLAEIAGDAASLINPDDVRGWAEGLHRVLTDDLLASALVERGVETAKRYTWQGAADNLVVALTGARR